MTLVFSKLIDELRALQKEQALITHRILSKEVELHELLAKTLEPYDHSIPGSVDAMLVDAVAKMNGATFTTDSIINYLKKRYPSRADVIDRGIHTALYLEQRRGGLTRLEPRLWKQNEI